MAVEVATLRFEADTRQLDEAKRKLDRLNHAANDAEGGQKGLARSTDISAKSLLNFKNIAIAAASALGAMKLIEVQRSFDVINASLITVTGSTEEAARAFGQIQQFAATTPYDLQQVSNAFVRLSALGLNPSEEALRSYGNTASAMGKDLIQMIEAVADASTFEFERLKEFGIKARQEADSVSFTFRGVTTTVGKSSQEIQDYLLAIGQTEFAGAMEQRANTLDGAISNLNDSFDQLFLAISAAGAGSAVENGVRTMTSGIEELTFQIKRMSDTMTQTDILEQIRRLQVTIGAAPQLAAAGITVNVQELEDRIAGLREQIDLMERGGVSAIEAQRQEQLRERQVRGAGPTPEQQAAALEEQRAQADAAAELLAAQEELKDRQFEVEQEYLARKKEAEQNAALEEREFRRSMVLASLEDNALIIEGIRERNAEEQRLGEEHTNRMMALGDALLRGKSEQSKAAYALAVNLMDKEKVENAKTIISNSYVAAMKAYASLAGIPFVGPALGAAAAGTVIAAGATYAAQSLSGRALGGQVRAGESYIVGERGPEVLTMGGMSGRITPNNAITNNNSKTVNRVANVSFQVVANDTAGFDELLQSRRGQIIGIINEALNDSGRSALV